MKNKKMMDCGIERHEALSMLMPNISLDKPCILLTLNHLKSILFKLAIL